VETAGTAVSHRTVDSFLTPLPRRHVRIYDGLQVYLSDLVLKTESLLASMEAFYMGIKLAANIDRMVCALNTTNALTLQTADGSLILDG